MDDLGGPRWFAVEVEVGRDEADAVSGELWAGGIDGIEERHVGDARVRLVASVRSERVDHLVRRLTGRRHEVHLLDRDLVIGTHWSWTRPVRVGRVAVVPSDWYEDLSDDEVTLRIDPGRSFGWGGHVTTRLSLELLQDQLTPGDVVLDVGTGTGVLAITAALLGAERVRALEIDPEAVATASANGVANGVAELVEVSSDPLRKIQREFDLVIANLERPALIDLAPGLQSAVGIGGRLVLAGFLVDQEIGVRDAFDRVDLDVRRVEGEWVALAGLARATEIT